ncbi:MAG: alpha-L-fucosidase [Bacteroidales bacterium]|nr:alpha-L-fucosidase [Bacteroidales bacterium]
MKTLLLIIFLSISLSARSQESHPYIPETDPMVLEKLEQWKDLKFGLLMHWGPYSQWGIVESWSLCSEDEPWCKRKMKNYVDYCREYEKLKDTFNPVNFDPESWARAAKEAGMKYVVFTTKHHDGFCMFDTKETDYRITDAGCPFSENPRSNVTKEIFDAFRNEGFLTGAYFSKPDWHCNDYWAEEWATPDRNVNYSIEKYPERWQKYCDFTKNQIEELMTEYGPVDILWLDGGWVAPQNGQDVNMGDIVEMARKHQPGLIVVDRAVGGRYENYRTPEQHIPGELLDYPWETCMTMAGSWSYVPNDRYKPTRKIVHLLADIVSKGGNYLLNIGPGPDGSWHDTAYIRLQEIGSWMKINGEAIYGSRPILPVEYKNIRFTCNPDGTVYLIYLANENEITLPSTIFADGFLPSGGSTIQLLGRKGDLKWKKEGTGFRIEIPASWREHPPCDYAWTFRIRNK